MSLSYLTYLLIFLLLYFQVLSAFKRLHRARLDVFAEDAEALSGKLGSILTKENINRKKSYKYKSLIMILEQIISSVLYACTITFNKVESLWASNHFKYVYVTKYF